MPPDIAALASYAPAPVKPATTPAPVASPAPQIAAPPSTPHASPVSLLDPSTGLVVIQFYDAKGDETQSLPTKKQLDLYRLNEPSFDVFQPAIHTVSPPTPEQESARSTLA